MEQSTRWRDKPETVMVKCQDIRPYPGGPDWIVQFETSERRFVAFVDLKFIDAEKMLLMAEVVADVGNQGDWLVGLPAEIYNASSRIVVKADERDQVLVTGLASWGAT